MDYIAIGGIIVGVILLGLMYKVYNVKGKTVANLGKGTWIFLFLLLTVGVLWLTNVGGLIDSSLESPLLTVAPVTVTTPTTPTTSTGCPEGFVKVNGVCTCGVDTTTVTLSGIYADTGGAVGGRHRYWIEGVSSTVADASTFTTSPGQVIPILWGNANTTGKVFGATSTETVPCKGAVTFSKQLYQNGTVTIQVFNEDGDVVGTSNNETLGAGDVTTLDIKIKGTYQTGYPNGGVLVLEYNKSSYDSIKAQLPSERKVGVPSFYSTTNTSSEAVAYEVDPFYGGEILGKLILDVSTLNPGAGPTEDFQTSGNVNITFYPYNYFINDDTGGNFDGPAAEDEDNTRTTTYTANTILTVI